MSYYSRWGLVIGTPLFQNFLQRSYVLGVSDLDKLHKKVNFSEANFTCMLSGVGNAATANSFIQFVLSRNSKAHIIIIDLGEKQVTEVKKLVQRNYSKSNITIHQVNALDLLSWLKSSSLNWIETDGFLEFFSPSQLPRLIHVWHTLLKPEGFVTIRETASQSKIGSIIDVLRIWLGKLWLGVQLYKFTLKDLETIFHIAGFKYISFPTGIPTYRRFTLVKK